MGHKGHYGEYSGNAKWSRDHAHTKVTKENYKASERDDAAHVDYLERDVKDDQRTGGKYKDENQTADEKHISKLEGDMKYDKEHHGSPAHQKKKMMKTVTSIENTNCAEGYIKNNKGKCVPIKVTKPKEKIRT
tara:strand:+ start:200 stop:598 length:399 start_codon:yes stop_codon:yes gene_type:complete